MSERAGTARKREKAPVQPARPAAAYEPASDSVLFVNAVEKAMRVLAAFDGRRRHLSLSEIALLAHLDLSAEPYYSTDRIAVIVMPLIDLMDAQREEPSDD